MKLIVLTQRKKKKKRKNNFAITLGGEVPREIARNSLERGKIPRNKSRKVKYIGPSDSHIP